MSDIAIQSDSFEWNDPRQSLELWIFSSAEWVDENGILHGAGTPRDRIFTQRVPGLTNNTTTHQLTVPAFDLTPTRNAIRGNTVKMSFWVMQVIGQNVTPIKPVPGTEKSLQIPESLSSISGCSPQGTCGTFADLIMWNTSPPAVPRETFVTNSDLTRLFETIAVGAPSGAKFIVNVPNGSLTNAQPLSALATGLLKNTTATGVLSTAVVATDYLAPGTGGGPSTGMGLDLGVANLTDPIMVGADAPQRLGLSTGTSGSPVTSRFPSLSMVTYTRPASGGGGTTAPYFFFTNRQNGGAQGAVYNLFGYVNSSDTNVSPRDIVAVAGIANSLSGSTSRAYGGYFVGAINNQNAGQGGIGIEADVQNDSGVDAPILTHVLPDGYTLGLALAPKGGKLNSAAINLQGSVGTSNQWRTGFHFPGTCIAAGGYGIDFAYLTMSADGGGFGGFPVRLGNNQHIVGYIGGVDRKLLALNASGLVSIDASSVGTLFGGGIRPGSGGFVSNTGQIYTTASQGLVITGAVGSSYDMLFANAAGTGTLLRNPTGTPHLQIGLNLGDVVCGGNNGALATSGTAGFLNISSMPGVPVGVPTAWTGYVPLVYDTADNRLYAYNAGWQNVSTAGGGGGGSVTSVAVSGTNGIGVSGSPITTSGTIALSLGAITPTSVNGLTIGTSTGTLNITNLKTVAHTATTTFAGTDGKTLTISNSGTLSGGDAFVLSIAAAKTFVVSNSLTLAGTDSTVMTFPTTTATIARTDAAQTFTGLQTFGTILSSTSITSPIHYGGTGAGATLSLQGSSNAAPVNAYILMNTNYGAGVFPGTVFIGAPSSTGLGIEAIHTQQQGNTQGGVVRDCYGTLGAADIFRQAGGSIASPTKTLSGHSLGSFGFRGYQETTSAFATANNAKIDAIAGEDFSSTAQGTYLSFGTTPLLSTTRAERLRIDPSGHLLFMTDNTQSIGLTSATRPSAIFLGAPAITPGSGTGITVVDSGSVRRQTYKVTVTYLAFAAAQLTQDSVIATFPAKTRITSIIADTTIKYIGGAVATCTLMVGKTAGGAEYIAVHDVFTAAVTKGLADADLGTSITRAAAIQGGDLPSWTGTTNVSVRLTSTVAFLNALTQGSTTYYITTEVFQ